MPIYEYRCKDCGAEFELLRSASASDDDLKCQYCGAPRVERQFSAFATSGGTGGGSYASSSSCGGSGGFT